MSKINKRAAGPALVTNAAATKYTVPAGRRAVVRHVHFVNPTGSIVNFTWSIGADASGTRIVDAIPVAANNGQYDDYGPYTLEATETIQALAGTNNVGTLTIDVEETLLT